MRPAPCTADQLTFICPDCLKRAHLIEPKTPKPGEIAWTCWCPDDHLWEVRLPNPRKASA